MHSPLASISVDMRSKAARPLPRMPALRCPACGTPFAEGVLGPDTLLLVRCRNRRCIARRKENMIQIEISPAIPHGNETPKAGDGPALNLHHRAAPPSGAVFTEGAKVQGKTRAGANVAKTSPESEQ